MTKNNGTTIEVMTEEVENVQNVVVDSAHKALQAGFGVLGMSQDRLSTVQEDAGSLFHKLVERGETVEADGRHFVNELWERRKQQVADVSDDLDGRIESVLTRMNLPTKADLNGLTEKINALSKKIDALKK